MEPNYAQVSASLDQCDKEALNKINAMDMLPTKPIWAFTSATSRTGKTSSNDQTCPQKPTLAI